MGLIHVYTFAQQNLIQDTQLCVYIVGFHRVFIVSNPAPVQTMLYLLWEITDLVYHNAVLNSQ